MWYTEGGKYQYQAKNKTFFSTVYDFRQNIDKTEIGIFVDVFWFFCCLKKSLLIFQHIMFQPQTKIHVLLHGSLLITWWTAKCFIIQISPHNQLFRCLKQLHLLF